MSLTQRCKTCGKSKVLETNYNKNKFTENGYSTVCKQCKSKISTLDEFKLYLSDNNIQFDQYTWDEAKKKVLSKLEKEYKNKDMPSEKVIIKKIISKYLSLGNLSGRYELKQENKDDRIIDLDIKSNFEVTPEMKKRWGSGWSKPDYEYMENIYQSFTSVYKHDTPVQKMLYEDIAKTRLEADRARKNGNLSLYEKLMNTVSKLMNDANIKPVQETAADNEGLSTWGQWVKKIEEEEPIPEPREEFKDVDRIEKYINKWFVGHFKKILGIESKNISDINVIKEGN